MKRGLSLLILVFLVSQLYGCDCDDETVTTSGGVTVVTTNNPNAMPPQAVLDEYLALGNAVLTVPVANGVLVNDTLNGATINSFDATSLNGATVVLNADGSFTYTPRAGFAGIDAFTYTLVNDDGRSTTIVKITIRGDGFFVDNSRATNGDGSQANPFNNLDSAATLANAGDTIFVFQGDGTSNNLMGNINIARGVILLGEGVGFALSGDPAQPPANRILAQTLVPAGTPPTVQANITLAGDNEVAGFRFLEAAGNTLTVLDLNPGTINIHNNAFENANFDALALTSDTATVQVNNNAFTSANANNFLVQTTVGNGAFTANDNNFTGGGITVGVDGNRGMGPVNVTINRATFTGGTGAQTAITVSTFNGGAAMATIDTVNVPNSYETALNMTAVSSNVNGNASLNFTASNVTTMASVQAVRTSQNQGNIVGTLTNLSADSTIGVNTTATAAGDTGLTINNSTFANAVGPLRLNGSNFTVDNCTFNNITGANNVINVNQVGMAAPMTTLSNLTINGTAPPFRMTTNPPTAAEVVWIIDAVAATPQGVLSPSVPSRIRLRNSSVPVRVQTSANHCLEISGMTALVSVFSGVSAQFEDLGNNNPAPTFTTAPTAVPPGTCFPAP